MLPFTSLTICNFSWALSFQIPSLHYQVSFLHFYLLCFLLAFNSVRMASCYAYSILRILDGVLWCFNKVVLEDQPGLLGPFRAACHKVQPSISLSKLKFAFTRTRVFILLFAFLISLRIFNCYNTVIEKFLSAFPSSATSFLFVSTRSNRVPPLVSPAPAKDWLQSIQNISWISCTFLYCIPNTIRK